jgi:hypothetical protein
VAAAFVLGAVFPKLRSNYLEELGAAEAARSKTPVVEV